MRLQKLDKENAIAAVTTIPLALEDEEGCEVAGGWVISSYWQEATQIIPR